MKRIIFRSGNLRMGGLERIFIEVLQNIDSKKYEILVIVDDDCGKENVFETNIPKNIKYYFLKPEKLIRITERIKDKKKNIYYKILYNIMMMVENKVMYFNMKKLLKKFGKIDILIDYDGGASKYIHKIKNIKQRIVWIHSSIPNLKKRTDKIKRFGKRLNRYDKIIVICDEMLNETKEIYPFLEKKLKRIYNSFDFENIILKSKDLSELNVEEKELLKNKYFLAVSRLDMVSKDYKTLLEAFSKLQNKDYLLYILGDGPDKENIEKLIENLNLKKRVFLLGRKKNPYVWMKNAYAFVHSSFFEGFGLVILEALILNKAVISSNCKVGPSEILLNGMYGELFDVGDSNKLFYKMNRFIEQPELKKKYEMLSKKAIERFNIKNVIKEIEQMLDES